MQPSSDQPTEPGGGTSPLRRFGPIVAIVAVIAIIAVVVVAGGGDDDDEPTETADTSQEQEGPAERPEGAISWTQAEEEGLDVEFPETCDPETGRVAIPYFFAAECFANADDNGGATHTGVTEDSITVLYYSTPETDPVLDFIQGPIANDDTQAQVEETVQAYVDMFNEYYQTYGRTVNVEIVRASGISTDEVAARADAQKAIEEHKPFAAFGGPLLTNAWADEMAAAGVVCISCGATGSESFREERAPYLPAVVMAGDQVNLHGAEYISKKLSGKPAEFAGDDFVDTERVFGHLYITSGEESEANAAQYKELLSERGVELAEQVSYELDPGRLPEFATNAISKLKAAGVTTVVLQADPVGPSYFTTEATNQEYFPEWVITGGTLTDTTAFGRTYDQEQWSHAFGFAQQGADTAPELDPGFFLHEWYTGEAPPADESAPVLYGNPALLFSVIQSAGPDLNPETFRDGLFSNAPTQEAITNPSLSWGDHGLWDELGNPNDWSGIDDLTEWWWDADATGLDEIQKEGTGMVAFVDGGKRYLPGTWTEDLKVFDDDGAVILIEEVPESEQPPEYPSPAG